MHSFTLGYDEPVGMLLSVLDSKQTHVPWLVHPRRSCCTDIKDNSILPGAIMRRFCNNSMVTPDYVLQFPLIFMLDK